MPQANRMQHLPTEPKAQSEPSNSISIQAVTSGSPRLSCSLKSTQQTVFCDRVSSLMDRMLPCSLVAKAFRDARRQAGWVGRVEAPLGFFHPRHLGNKPYHERIKLWYTLHGPFLQQLQGEDNNCIHSRLWHWTYPCETSVRHWAAGWQMCFFPAFEERTYLHAATRPR